MSAEAPARVEPRYWHLYEDDIVKTYGGQVADMCDGAGYAPDLDQRALLNGTFAVGRHGQSVAFAIGIIACRQNIKTAVGKMAALGWMFLFNCDPIVWTAHEWDTVEEAVRDLDEIISGWGWMRRQIRSFNRQQRSQEIITRGGGRMIFKTRTPGGGRGLSGEKVLIDEAWRARAAHVGSLTPTMSARSITGDPQIMYLSSAAHEDSEVLHPLIERGRAASANRRVALLERRLLYCEYCAPDPEEACDLGAKCTHALDVPGCGCDKPDMVARANPAVGRRISMEFILGAERRDMLPHEYGRERMGWHDKPLGQAQVIPLLAWAGGLDEKSGPRGSIALSVVYTSDKMRAAIGLSGRRRDGDWHVELADYLDTDQALARVRKIIAKARRLNRQCVGVAVDRSAHEAAIIRPLELARVPVERMSAQDVCTSFAGFYQAAVKEGSLRHIGQDELTVAILGAGTRMVGDAGEAWGRKISGVEIAPAVAVSHARWLHEMKAPDLEAEPGAWAL